MYASPLIRLIPLQPSQLPSHPSLSSTDSSEGKRPDLLPFTLTLLNQASSTFQPIPFTSQFISKTYKPAPPSNNEVECLSCTIPSSSIAEIKWQDPDTTGGVGRSKPRDTSAEYWFARRSYHANVSSKQNPATASWEEFVFGLRDNHSKNEAEFTPTLYDARRILDWNEELDNASKAWQVDSRTSESPNSVSYTNMTLAIYEMCHELPFPLQPRCFPVLVATASTSEKMFVAVTVPVNLSSFQGAFYSNGKNRTEGEDSTRRKQVVLGVYTAVEKCELIEKGVKANGENPNTKEELIEWIMATASDAKGNLPMLLQRSSIPGEIVKDVGYFLKWIHTVDDAVVKRDKPQEFAQDKQANGERKRSRGLSEASKDALSSVRSSLEKGTSLAPPSSPPHA